MSGPQMSKGIKTTNNRCRLCPGLRFQHPWFLWYPLVTWGTEINTDPGCSRATDSDMALGNRLGLDVTMIRPGVSAGHPHQYGPGGSMALGYQHDLWWLTRSQACVASGGNTGHEHQPLISFYVGCHQKTWLGFQMDLLTQIIQPRKIHHRCAQS